MEEKLHEIRYYIDTLSNNSNNRYAKMNSVSQHNIDDTSVVRRNVSLKSSNTQSMFVCIHFV